MEKLLRAAILIPIIVAIMQGVKQLIPTSLIKFMRILTCGVGVMAAYGYVAAMEITTMNNAMIIFGGIIAGLSAAGLYEAGKNTITSIK
jgi:type III secretory pathway component EscS